MRVLYDTSVRNEETKAYDPVQKTGEVVAWLVVPDQQVSYGDPTGITLYEPSAIVKTDEGDFVTVRVWELHHKEGH